MADEGVEAADAVSRAEHLRHALRWLASPVTVAGLVLLVVNDHVLKPLWPGLVTGKLSDVAGMVVAPPLVALALAAVRRVHRPHLVATVATGVGFVVTKTTEAGAAGASWVWSLGTPTFIRADVTDLVALPALGLAWWAARRAQDGSVAVRTRLRLALGTALLPAAVLATAATSPCPDFPDVRSVLVVSGGLESTPASWSEDLVLRTTPGFATVDTGGIVRLSTDDAQRVEAMLRAAGGVEVDEAAGARTCARTRPEWCWRASAEHPGSVEASTDGGATWGITSWVSEDEREQVLDGLGSGCGGERAARYEVGDLAVVETPRGPVVVAALRHAGVLLRGPTGVWSRVPADALRRARPSATPPEDPPTGDLVLVEPTPSPRPSPSSPGPTAPPRTQPGRPGAPPVSPPSV